MSYGSRTNLKLILKIPSSNSDLNDYLDNMLSEASSYMDNTLGIYTTVPISSTPTVVNHIANTWAAGIFRENQTHIIDKDEALRTAEIADILINRAEKNLDNYIEKTYRTDSTKGRAFGGRVDYAYHED